MIYQLRKIINPNFQFIVSLHWKNYNILLLLINKSKHYLWLWYCSENFQLFLKTLAKSNVSEVEGRGSHISKDDVFALINSELIIKRISILSSQEDYG